MRPSTASARARLPARAGGEPGRPRGARCPTTFATPTPTPPPDRSQPRLAIRRLTYADLPQVVAIERRAFPAPWSLAMFVLELSKPAGICLASHGPADDRGYLICSRYDTVWHLMDLAVDPDRRRRGIATRLMDAPAGAPADPTST